MRKIRKISWLVVLGMLVGMILFVVVDVKAVDVNPDYTNKTGECIEDVAVVLDGEYTVTDHMDGHSDEAHFETFTWWYDEDNDETWLLWDDVTNGDCTEEGKEGWIADGEEFHVGWTTDPDSDESDVDEVYGSVPAEGGAHVKAGDFDMVNVRGRFVGSIFLFTVKNDILPQRTMYVNNFRYKLVAYPYVLADLNGRVLNGLLTPITGGGTLAFNAELAVQISLDEWEAHLPHVVIAFDVKEQGSSGNPNTIYMEFHPKPVGGTIISVDKLGLLAPYIGLASTILVATATTTICVKRVKRRKGA
jgi:hypothetical protein